METSPRKNGIVKRQHVRLETSAACAPARAAGAPAQSTPSVRLLRLDDETHALEFTCACGDVALIEIEYETPQ
ncbi:MAG TPA: hypothetical protein VF530_23520 [Planctomycetota bacterium]